MYDVKFDYHSSWFLTKKYVFRSKFCKLIGLVHPSIRKGPVPVIPFSEESEGEDPLEISREPFGPASTRAGKELEIQNVVSAGVSMVGVAGSWQWPWPGRPSLASLSQSGGKLSGRTWHPFFNPSNFDLCFRSMRSTKGYMFALRWVLARVSLHFHGISPPLVFYIL